MSIESSPMAPADKIEYHYHVEKELADRLRHATKDERRTLYRSLYDELFCRVPSHVQLARKQSPAETARVVAWQMRLLRPLLMPHHTFLEIGPGDCALAIEVAKHVERVYAVDVSAQIAAQTTLPANLELILSDGCSVPAPPQSVDVAYSNQLMEHLHSDDAVEQLQNIYAALKPGGVYLCITPNKLNGPHDISFFFDTTATGFHLKEYTTRELSRLFRTVGFSRVRAYVGGRGRFVAFPVPPIAMCEMLLERLPPKLCTAVARSCLLRMMLGIRIVGQKR